MCGRLLLFMFTRKRRIRHKQHKTLANISQISTRLWKTKSVNPSVL